MSEAQAKEQARQAAKRKQAERNERETEFRALVGL